MPYLEIISGQSEVCQTKRYVKIILYVNIIRYEAQNRSTEGCSKLKRSVDMKSSGKNGLNIRTNASPKWDKWNQLIYSSKQK